MPSAWKLIIEDDAGKQIVVPFTRDVITIGRKEGNTIRLTERNVSRQHAKLSKDNGHVVIEDLKSFNGVKLNGERIDGRVLVNEGDTIQIGDYHLAVHAEGAAVDDTPDSGATLPPPHKQNGQAVTARIPPAALPSPEKDDFAGDTQRWQPTPEAQGGGAAATQEDRTVSTDEQAGQQLQERLADTMRIPASGGFGADNGDTERVTLDLLASMKAGAPTPFASSGEQTVAHPEQEEDLEPTVRQSASPTLPGAAPPSGAAPADATGVAPAMPGIAPLVGDARRPDNDDTAAARPALPQLLEELPRLVVLNTIFAGSSFPLRANELVIGRTEDNDITIEHKSVSRNHAKVVREGDRVRILDLKSANGVLVNDEEVEAAVLRSGDVVELGRVRLRFVPPGERFVVPPDEIERARLADTGNDDDDPVTSAPATRRQLAPPSGSFDTVPAGKSNIVWLALGVFIVLLVLAGFVYVNNTSATEPAPEMVEAPPPPLDEAVGVDIAPVDPAPAAKRPSPPPRAAAVPKVPPTEDVPEQAPDDSEPDEASAPIDEVEEEAAGAQRVVSRPRVTRQRKRLDIEKNLREASAALKTREFDNASRLAKEVLDAAGASADQKTKARTQLMVACGASPTSRACR